MPRLRGFKRLSAYIIIIIIIIFIGARGNVVVKALCYNRNGVGSIPDEVIF
jgi:hypothetical protein